MRKVMATPRGGWNMCLPFLNPKKLCLQAQQLFISALRCVGLWWSLHRCYMKLRNFPNIFIVRFPGVWTVFVFYDPNFVYDLVVLWKERGLHNIRTHEQVCDSEWGSWQSFMWRARIHRNSTSEAAILSSLPYPSLTYFNYHLLIKLFFFDKNGGIELKTYVRKKNACSAGIIIH